MSARWSVPFSPSSGFHFIFYFSRPRSRSRPNLRRYLSVYRHMTHFDLGMPTQRWVLEVREEWKRERDRWEGTAAGGCHGNSTDCYTAHVNRRAYMREGMRNGEKRHVLRALPHAGLVNIDRVGYGHLRAFERCARQKWLECALYAHPRPHARTRGRTGGRWRAPVTKLSFLLSFHTRHVYRRLCAPSSNVLPPVKSFYWNPIKSAGSRIKRRGGSDWWRVAPSLSSARVCVIITQHEKWDIWVTDTFPSCCSGNLTALGQMEESERGKGGREELKMKYLEEDAIALIWQ